LELADFAALPLDLDPHPLNCRPDEFKLHPRLLNLPADSGGWPAFPFEKPQPVPQSDDSRSFTASMHP
jgi:hypothetical protein